MGLQLCEVSLIAPHRLHQGQVVTLGHEHGDARRSRALSTAQGLALVPLRGRTKPGQLHAGPPASAQESACAAPV
jgi:hypothetical protein